MRVSLSKVSNMMRSNSLPRRRSTYNLCDLAVALTFMALGLAAIANVLQTSNGDANHFDLRSATFFPLLTALILVITSICLTIRAIRSTTPAASPSTDKPRSLRAGIATFVMVLYAAAIFRFGFWMASSGAIVLMALLLAAKPLSRRELGWLAATALAVPGMIIVVFNVFLAVQMPVGGSA